PTLEAPVNTAPSTVALQAAYYMQPITIGVQQLEVVVTGDPEIAAGTTNTAAIPWQTILLWVYLAGVIISGVRLLYGMWQIYALYRKSQKEKRSQHTLVNTPTLHTPFSFFRLLFWSQALPYPKSDAAKIIRHEQAHMDGWHSLDILIVEVLGVLFWFNPLIYLYTRALRTVHEYLADEAVLHHSKKTTYGHLLIRQSQSGQAIALANHFSHVQLKKRILMMTKKKSHRHQLFRYALSLPLVAALTFAFTLPATPTGPAKAAALDGNDPKPVFKGCETLESSAAQKNCTSEKVIAFIQENLKYPEAAKKEGKEGMAVVSFTVAKNGALTDIKVVKSAGSILDEAALSVVRQMPDWVPAKDDQGKSIATTMSLPFQFRLPESDVEEIFTVVEEMPQFPGCEDITQKDERQSCANNRLMSYIFTNLVYPEAAKKAGIEGMPVLKLVIGKAGEIKAFSLSRSVDESLDNEVLRLAAKMQEEITWVPGKQRGQNVNVSLQIPIRFKLDDNDVAEVPEPAEADGEVFKIVEQMPQFPGCQDIGQREARQQCSNQKMLEFIYKNVKYPAAARKAGIEGIVVAGLTIGKDGKLQSFKLARTVNPILDEEVARVVQLMQDQITWIPGEQRGKKVAVEIMLPVKFRLPAQENTIKEEAPKNTINILAYAPENKTTDAEASEASRPLFVLNGKKLPGVQNAEGISDLNPDDIDRINVIKGEEAIKKYGQDAANGVVEIFTKSGKQDIIEVPQPQSLKLRGFRVSPNPTNGKLRVRFKGEAVPTSLRILSLNGQELLSQALPQFDGNADETLNLSNLPKGTLLLEVRQGDRVSVEKVILK
ncbi:MAG: TonB family protein, partial [Phaeodactylibacter sp.]|nr:TonB family protein [Phaeodactylibacter sp.]